MLHGQKHTVYAKRMIGNAHKNRWESYTPRQKKLIIRKMQRGRRVKSNKYQDRLLITRIFKRLLSV
jgi:hypothetical protein